MLTRQPTLEFIVVQVLSAIAASSNLCGQTAVHDGKHLFEMNCRPCHSISVDGTNKIGPPLYGVFGRRAGSVDGFRYSDAIAYSRVVWNYDTLTAFIAKPSTFLPGTRMPFPGLPDADEREALIAYLKAQSP
jgi:cytochrome c